MYFYVGSAFTFVSRHRHGCCDTLLAALRVFIVLICFCHRILLSDVNLNTMMVAVTAMLVSVAELSNIFSVLAVLICFCAMVLFIMR